MKKWCPTAVPEKLSQGAYLPSKALEYTSGDTTESVRYGHCHQCDSKHIYGYLI